MRSSVTGSCAFRSCMDSSLPSHFPNGSTSFPSGTYQLFSLRSHFAPRSLAASFSLYGTFRYIRSRTFSGDDTSLDTVPSFRDTASCTLSSMNGVASAKDSRSVCLSRRCSCVNSKSMMKSQIFSASAAALKISRGSSWSTLIQLWTYAAWESTLTPMPNSAESIMLPISARSSSFA